MKNNESEAKRSLKWYRGEAYEDEPELQKLKQLAIISRKKVKHFSFRIFIRSDWADQRNWSKVAINLSIRIISQIYIIYIMYIYIYLFALYI